MAKKVTKKAARRPANGAAAKYLIHFYGELWNPDMIEWGRQGPGGKGKLLGKFKRGKTTHEVDFWEQRGVYALYLDFKLVYVGQVFDGPLGYRMRTHLTDRFGGRWDMFSWFGASTVRATKCQLPGQRQLRPRTVIDTMESVLIAVADPPLNRKRNSIPGAIQVAQPKSKSPHTIRAYLERLNKAGAESFEGVNKKLDRIEDAL